MAILAFMPAQNAKVPPPKFYFEEWAKKLGKRQRDIVAKTGLDKSYISLLWSGDKIPSQGALENIADAMEIPSAALRFLPNTFAGRMLAASRRVPKNREDAAIEMLEAFAQGSKSA